MSAPGLLFAIRHARNYTRMTNPALRGFPAEIADNTGLPRAPKEFFINLTNPQLCIF